MDQWQWDLPCSHFRLGNTWEFQRQKYHHLLRLGLHNEEIEEKWDRFGGWTIVFVPHTVALAFFSCRAAPRTFKMRKGSLMSDVRQPFQSLLNGLNNTVANWVGLEAT